MKKILLTLIFLLIVSPVSASVMYSLSPVSYQVLVNGSKLNSELPILTYKTTGDNTYVPLKAVLDLTGAKTTWDGEKVNISIGPDPAKVADSVVMIYVSKDGKKVGYGSGVLLDYDEIVTSSHVISKGDAYEIIYNFDGKTMATVKKDSPESDVAILEPVEKKRKSVKIGDSDEVMVGDEVFTISSPKENMNIVTKGRVSRIIKEGMIVTATGDFGSSGGGLFLVRNGELIGVIDSTHNKNKQILALPINQARKALID